MKTSKRFRIAVLVFITLAAGLYITARLAYYSPPDESLPVSPADAAAAAREITAVEREVRMVGRAAGEGKRQPFELQVGERQLTNFLRSDKTLASGLKKRSIEAPHVQFKDQEVVTRCLVTTRNRKVHVTVSGRLLHAEDGTLTFHCRSVLLGKLPAPSPVRRRVEKAVNDYLLVGRLVLPADITDIRSDDGTLVIKGMSDPEVGNGDNTEHLHP